MEQVIDRYDAGIVLAEHLKDYANHTNVQQKLLAVINEAAEPISAPTDYSALLEQIGDARFVMMGEATHGTQEFYQARIEITQQLIQKKGFMAVAIEGDWPNSAVTKGYRCYLSA